MLFKESYKHRDRRLDKIDASLHMSSKMITQDTGSREDISDAKNIMKYVGYSHPINKALIQSKPLGAGDAEVHNTIMKHARPLGQDIRLYSGTGHDFGAIARASEDGIVHSPAHISTSHSVGVAHMFASHGNRFKGQGHFLEIHAKANDKGIPVGYMSHRTEREVILPAGTKLKYHGTRVKSMADHNGEMVPYQIHKFTIHSQD